MDKGFHVDFDIIIAGGGVVGLTLANLLSKNKTLFNKRILLLDNKLCDKNQDLRKPLQSFQGPVYAITPRSAEIFKSLGIWSNIDETRVKNVLKMQIWDSYSNSDLVFKKNMVNPLMYIVEHRLLVAALVKSLKYSQVEIKNKSKIESYKFPTDAKDNPVEILLDGHKTLKTDLLIGTDGFNSLVRRTLNPPCYEWDYNKTAITATLNLSKSGETLMQNATTDMRELDNSVAWQKFTSRGIIAFLPLNTHQSSLVWSTSTRFGYKLMQMDEESFVDQLNNALWDDNDVKRSSLNYEKYIDPIIDALFSNNYKTSKMRQYPPRISHIDRGSRIQIPLKFLLATKIVQPRVALVGDSWHRVHPLAGQGLNLGLGDAYSLNYWLTQSASVNYNIGNKLILQRYQTERFRYVWPVITAINGLNLLYDNSPNISNEIDLKDNLFQNICDNAKNTLRSLGLQLTNALPGLKDSIIRYVS